MDAEAAARGIEQSNEGRANQSIIIDTGKYIAVVGLFGALAGIAASFAFFSYQTAQHAEKRAELASYYLMDPHSRTPEELAAWAKFNKEHEEH